MSRAHNKLADTERHLSDTVPLTVGRDCIRSVLQGAVLRGHDPQVILKRAGLPSDLYSSPARRIDGREFHRLVYAIQGELNDLFMGFMEPPAKLALERTLSSVRYQCATMGEALRTSTQFRESARNDISFDYIDDAERHEFTLAINYQTKAGVDRELFHWHRLMSIYRYYSWLIGRRIVLSHASFEGPEPERSAVRQRYSIFDCEIRFGQPCYAITFDKKYLLCPIVRKSEAEAIDYMVGHPDWFSVPGQGASWTRQTEQVLARMQQSGVWSPAISIVGAMLFLSPQGLRRRLAKEGASFSDVKARMRCELAIAYLMATDVPVTVIAEYVGFSEPGDFTRAFIKWTGVNPSTYRTEHAQDKDLIAACTARLHARSHLP